MVIVPSCALHLRLRANRSFPEMLCYVFEFGPGSLEENTRQLCWL